MHDALPIKVSINDDHPSKRLSAIHARIVPCTALAARFFSAASLAFEVWLNGDGWLMAQTRPTLGPPSAIIFSKVATTPASSSGAPFACYPRHVLVLNAVSGTHPARPRPIEHCAATSQ